MMLSYLKHIALWLGKRKFKAQSKETMFKVKNIILSLALLGCSGLAQAQLAADADRTADRAASEGFGKAGR